MLGVTLLTVVSGCTARGRSFSSRFVKPGEPSTSFDVPGEAPKIAPKPEGLSDYARQIRTLQANARTTISLGNVLESQNPALASALLKLKMLPTAANHREVAQAYTTAGITDFAYRHYRQALRIEPCDSGALEGLARLWRQWGAHGLALGDAHRAVHCRPTSASAQTHSAPCWWPSVSWNRPRPHSKPQGVSITARRLRSTISATSPFSKVTVRRPSGHASEPWTWSRRWLPRTATWRWPTHFRGDVSIAEGRLMDRADTATGLYNVGVLRMAMNQYSAAAAAFDLAAEKRPSLGDAARRAAQARVKAAAAVKEQ